MATTTSPGGSIFRGSSSIGGRGTAHRSSPLIPFVSASTAPNARGHTRAGLLAELASVQRREQEILDAIEQGPTFTGPLSGLRQRREGLVSELGGMGFTEADIRAPPRPLRHHSQQYTSRAKRGPFSADPTDLYADDYYYHDEDKKGGMIYGYDNQPVPGLPYDQIDVAAAAHRPPSSKRSQQQHRRRRGPRAYDPDKEDDDDW